MDISGPHSAGRWPPDAPEALAERAIYVVAGAYTACGQEELQRIAKDTLAAADASGFTVTEGPLKDIDETQGVLYYARPLEPKHSDERIAALQDSINDIRCRYKA